MKRFLHIAATKAALAVAFGALPYAVQAAGNGVNMPTASQIGIPSTTSDIGGGLTSIVKLLMIVVGMLAVVFILIGAIQMSASMGNSQRYETAKNTIINAVAGIILAVAAYAIVSFISGSVKP